MKRFSIFKTGIALFSIIVIFLTSCAPGDGVYTPAGDSVYVINGKSFNNPATKNTTLKAIEVLCNNNNTLRMYYSDSVATMGFPSTLKVVSYGKAGKLGYHECYFEVVTSATDTYLSSGTDTSSVNVTGNGQYFDFLEVPVQHFTSVPLDEFTKIRGRLQLNP
jgi:hypothetical protein